MKISNGRKVGDDYFYLKKLRSSDNSLEYYLNQFNVDDYWILKASDRFRLVSNEEFLTFKYACFIFFKKDVYSLELIKGWLEFLYSGVDLRMLFLVKPFPPLYVKSLLKIIETL